MKTPHNATARDHLEAVGQTIYGDAWKAPMARELSRERHSLFRSGSLC